MWEFFMLFKFLTLVKGQLVYLHTSVILQEPFVLVNKNNQIVLNVLDILRLTSKLMWFNDLIICIEDNVMDSTSANYMGNPSSILACATCQGLSGLAGSRRIL